MLDAVVTHCLEKVLNILEEKGRTVMEHPKLLQGLKLELQYIQSFRKDADSGVRSNEVLGKLLSDLTELVYEAEDILADCQLLDCGDEDGDSNEQQRLANTCGLRFHPTRRYKESQRLKDVTDRILSLKSTVEIYLKPRKQSNVGRDDRWSSQLCDPTQAVGLEDDKRKIKEWLTGSNESELLMMAFVGMGGLGKTRMAQELFRDKDVEKLFEIRIWVYVSQNVTVEEIMRSILSNLKVACVGDDPGALLLTIHDALFGKRYLLVMDDVWDTNLSSWDSIYKGLPRGGSVIVTTRSETVAGKVQAGDKIHRPGILSDGNSWLLFCKVAFAGNNGTCDHPDLESVGKEIVRKCEGLPLAIKEVGGLLRYKDHVYHVWRRIADNFPDEIRGDGSETNNVMSSLRLSYDELPSHLK